MLNGDLGRLRLHLRRGDRLQLVMNKGGRRWLVDGRDSLGRLHVAPLLHVLCQR